MNRKRIANTIIAIGMLLLGVYIILLSIGLSIIRLRYVWPLIPAWVGAASLLQFAADQDKRGGLVFFGTLLFCFAVLAFPFTLRLLTFSRVTIGQFWPLIPLIIGVAFLVLYISAGLTDPTLLVVASIMGGVALLALPITLGTVRTEAFRQTVRYWPLLVLFLVLGLLFGSRLVVSADS